MLYTTYLPYAIATKLETLAGDLGHPFKSCSIMGLAEFHSLSKILHKVQNIVCDAMSYVPPYQVVVLIFIHKYKSICHQLL